MGIRYYKLFDLLNRKDMKKSDLREIISSATVAKLSKGEYISGEAIEKICRFLECQPGDIMEIVAEENPYSDIVTEKIIDELYEHYKIYHDRVDRNTFREHLLKCLKRKQDGNIEVKTEKLERLLEMTYRETEKAEMKNYSNNINPAIKST